MIRHCTAYAAPYVTWAVWLRKIVSGCRRFNLRSVSVRHYQRTSVCRPGGRQFDTRDDHCGNSSSVESLRIVLSAYSAPWSVGDQGTLLSQSNLHSGTRQLTAFLRTLSACFGTALTVFGFVLSTFRSTSVASLSTEPADTRNEL